MGYEIERKYLVNEYPKHLEVINKYDIEQFYFKIKDISISEETRIRKISNKQEINYYITIKSAGNIIREENEYPITEKTYNYLKLRETNSNLIPVITKEQTIFSLPDNIHNIEYNVVDKDINDGWRYVEVEFDSIEEANEFDINRYISNAIEVTNDPKYKMKNYWFATRSNIFKPEEDTAYELTLALHPYVNAVTDHINEANKLIYDGKNKKNKSMFVIPGGFRNIRLAIMANEFKANPPHFHFYKYTSPIESIKNDGKGGGCLLINDTKHFKHGSHQDRINYIELKALKKFLEVECLESGISTWKYILTKWNELNPHSIQVDINTPIPNYYHNMMILYGAPSKNKERK